MKNIFKLFFVLALVLALGCAQMAGAGGLPSAPAAPVAPGGMAAVTVQYRGFDGARREGVLIIAPQFAAEVIAIFADIYASGYAIEKMQPVSVYKNDDGASMAANNTSAYNYRLMTGGSQLSFHALGAAIDINPLYNPYVKGKQIEPPQAAPYTDRKNPHPALIRDGGPVVKAFKKHGWEWGGDWQTLKDYQHFQKPLPATQKPAK